MILKNRPPEYSTTHAIGDYGGCTAIPISPRWLITARHVVDPLVVHIRMPPIWEDYKVLRRVDHPAVDLALILVDHDLPHWYPPFRSELVMERWCLMLGYGLTGEVGQSWQNMRRPQVGSNRVSQISPGRLVSTFDADGADDEAQAANNDSGGAWLVDDCVAGIFTGVNRFGSCQFGDQTYGPAIFPYLSWIDANIADLDGDGQASAGDVSIFLRAWYAVGGGRVQLLWDYLASWSAGRKSI